MSKDVLIVIPAYNEEKTIGKVVQALKVEGFMRILVVNDGSEDQTEMAAFQKGAEIINHLVNLGKGAALKSGFEYAIGNQFKYVITCDADGQHLAKDVRKIADNLLQEKADVILGTRFNNKALLRDKIPISRKVFNKLANIVNFIISGVNASDSQCGLRGYNRKAISAMDLESRGLDIDSEILGEVRGNKLQFKEVKIEPVYTQYSLSKGQNFLKGLETLYRLLIKEF